MASDHTACMPKPSPLEPTTSPHTAESTVPTSLGTLSVLPRELRDEIYKHVWGFRWHFFPNPSEFYRNRTSKHDSDLPMIKLSKATRHEFLTAFYAEVILSVHDEESRGESTSPRGEMRYTPDDIAKFGKVQKLEVSAMLYSRSDHYYKRIGWDRLAENKRLSERRAEPLSFVAGVGGPRKTCGVILEIHTPKAILILQSPFFDAIKRLTNFRVVTLNVSSMKDFGWSRRDALEYLAGDSSWTKDTGGVKTLVDAITSALEPALGPSILEKGTIDGGIRWKIEFHPRAFVSQKDREASNLLGR